MDSNQFAKLVSITEAAELVGVSTTTLRRWEDIGRIKPQRLAHGQRIYTEDDIQTLRRLKEEPRYD